MLKVSTGDLLPKYPTGLHSPSGIMEQEQEVIPETWQLANLASYAYMLEDEIFIDSKMLTRLDS